MAAVNINFPKPIKNGLSKMADDRIASVHWGDANPSHSPESFFENRISHLLTVGELASLLHCSAGTIRNWVWKGEIPIVRVGRRMVRFNAAEIRKWLSERNVYA